MSFVVSEVFFAGLLGVLHAPIPQQPTLKTDIPENNNPAIPNRTSLANNACTNITMPMPKRKNLKKLQLEKMDCFMFQYLFVIHITHSTSYKRLCLAVKAVISLFRITQ